jgi:hypothetical protein
MTVIPDDKGAGWKEGFARGISQACVYAIEARKSASQVGIRALRADIPHFVKGMMESAISSGIVFGMYFSTFNGLGGSQNVIASPIATFVTSLIKTPISNGMRLRQVGYANDLLGATKKIVRMQGHRGLYNGYVLSVIEDIIEFDIRIRLYDTMKSFDKSNNPFMTIGFGAIAGMFASYVTSPFDTIRANMTITGKSATACIADIFNTATGLQGFYRGAHLRMASNGLKYGMFFMIYESLRIKVL